MICEHRWKLRDEFDGLLTRIWVECAVCGHRSAQVIEVMGLLTRTDKPSNPSR